MTITIAKHDIKNFFIDSRSSTDDLFYDTFIWMKLPENQLRWVSTLLNDFSSDFVRVEGEITLPFTVRTLP